jgi:hypothetical protein
MPALAPHRRLVDATSQQRLRRRADALAPAELLEEIRRAVTIDERRLECARDHLECGDGAANLLEHAPSRVRTTAGKRQEVRSG